MFLADSSSVPSVTEVVQYLNLPLSLTILYGFARGWFVTGKEHERVVAERDKEREERIEAQRALTDKALPALQANEQTMSRLVDAVERIDPPARRSR